MSAKTDNPPLDRLAGGAAQLSTRSAASEAEITSSYVGEQP